MSALGNIVWLIFGGVFAGIGYFLAGLILCATIIGIPFGVQAMHIGIAALMPFGKQVVPKARGSGCLPVGFNILWVVLFGWVIAINHLLFGLILAVTIVGMPFARQHFKLLKLSILPFSYKLQ